MSRETTLGSYNLPSRYPKNKRERDVDNLHGECSVLGFQEFGMDSLDAALQNGWWAYIPRQPGRGYVSTPITWDPTVWTLLDVGQWQISNSKFVGRGSWGYKHMYMWARYIVAAKLRNETLNRTRWFASTHFVASKHVTKAREQMFVEQARRTAQILRGRPRLLLAGDFNADPADRQMRPMQAVPNITKRTAQTKGNRRIDHVWTNGQKTRLGSPSTYKGVSDHDALLVPFTML